MTETSKKIIITRDRDKAAPLMAALEPFGILSCAVPVTRTIFDVSKTFTEDLNDYNCIAFTSANAVEAFAIILNNSGVKLKRGSKIFAVGSSTATAAERVFRKPDLVPEKGDAASLAEAIIVNTKDPSSLKIFWPCAVEALPNFERILAKAGADVMRWECYRTAALDPKYIKSELESLAPWDLVFFAAPGAVKAFSAAWEERSGFIALAIGPTTETALVAAGYERVVASKGTSIIKCAGAIIDVLKVGVWS